MTSASVLLLQTCGGIRYLKSCGGGLLLCCSPPWDAASLPPSPACSPCFRSSVAHFLVPGAATVALPLALTAVVVSPESEKKVPLPCLLLRWLMALLDPEAKQMVLQVSQGRCAELATFRFYLGPAPDKETPTCSPLSWLPSCLCSSFL